MCLQVIKEVKIKENHVKVAKKNSGEKEWNWVEKKTDFHTHKSWKII